MLSTAYKEITFFDLILVFRLLVLVLSISHTKCWQIIFDSPSQLGFCKYENILTERHEKIEITDFNFKPTMKYISSNYLYAEILNCGSLYER